MSEYIIDSTLLTNIADAVRSVDGSTSTLTPQQMETRLNAVKSSIDSALSALTAKEVEVPSGSTVHRLAELIMSIESGNEEIYFGSITPTSDNYSIGIEVNDPLKHTNGDCPQIALFVDTTNFTPGEYVTAMGIINGIAFRHVGTIPTEFNNYEYYIRGSASTDEELGGWMCKFYGSKTWFYGQSLRIVLGPTNNVTNCKLFKAGITYHYYIRY